MLATGPFKVSFVGHSLGSIILYDLLALVRLSTMQYLSHATIQAQTVFSHKPRTCLSLDVPRRGLKLHLALMAVELSACLLVPDRRDLGN